MHAHARTGARKVETDLAHARSRIVQLESSLRSKDRDHDKLGRTIEALKQEAAEAAARIQGSQVPASRKTRKHGCQ
eukprot:scaffold56950_cov21-Tisochrysis_lutea.AAC.1